MNSPVLNRNVAGLEPSKIRARNAMADRLGAINLTQGTPSLSPPEEAVQALLRAIAAGSHRYVPPPGVPEVREAVAEYTRSHLGLDYDPGTEVTICSGATAGVDAALTAIINIGDEVILTRPTYENYYAQCRIANAHPRFVNLRPPAWRLDLEELKDAFNSQTKAIILCNPNNPTGSLLTREELACIAELCQEWDVLAITDEVYDHILFDGRKHVSLATIDGMRERSIVVNSTSKTYSVSGWRLGTVLAPKERRISEAIRNVIDYRNLCVNSCATYASIAAYALPKSYYDSLAAEYQERRDLLATPLRRMGFDFCMPEGAYYILARVPVDVSGRELADNLLGERGVGVIPGECFFGDDPEKMGDHFVRFCYCKERETLEEGVRRLAHAAQ